MHLDVMDLRNFYYRTALGKAARRAIRGQVVRLWPNCDSQTLVGYGFAAPVLRPYLGKARRIVCLMPGPQGVMPWPSGKPNVSVLCEESLWPLQNGQADRLILLHGLETSGNPSKLLEECSRVLAPSGRMLLIVPNRSGIWARRDKTPFGFGRPYSLGQLEAQLRRHSLNPERHAAALFQPPSDRRFWLRAGPAWERMAQRMAALAFAGVLLVEASKDVHARPREIPEAVKRPLRALEGIARPGAKPA